MAVKAGNVTVTRPPLAEKMAVGVGSKVVKVVVVLVLAAAA